MEIVLLDCAGIVRRNLYGRDRLPTRAHTKYDAESHDLLETQGIIYMFYSLCRFPATWPIFKSEIGHYTVSM